MVFSVFISNENFYKKKNRKGKLFLGKLRTINFLNILFIDDFFLTFTYKSNLIVTLI